MHKLFYLTLFSILFLLTGSLVSCSKKEHPIPDYIIQPDSMTSILVDMQIAEAILLHLKHNNLNIEGFRKELYNLVLEKHNISKGLLDSSLNYYSTNNLKLLDRIYADVITSLSQKQSEQKSLNIKLKD